MKIKSVMKSKFLLILPCILVPMMVRAAQIPVSEEVQIEPVASFTTFELWNSKIPTNSSFGLVAVNYRMIDSETPIVRGKWRECGLVMIGTGDLATRPVAFRIWTKQACDLSMQDPKESESAGEIRINFFVNAGVLLPVKVSSELVVTVSERKIGRIRAEGE